MASALTGKAATWFGPTRLCIAEEDRVVDVLADHLRAKYGRRESASQIFNSVMQRKKMPDKTFEEFAEALEDLGLGSTLEEEQYVEAFINGVSPLVRASLVARVSTTLIEACDRAHRMAGGNGAVSERATKQPRHAEYARGDTRVLTATPGLSKYGRREARQEVVTKGKPSGSRTSGSGSATIDARVRRRRRLRARVSDARVCGAVQRRERAGIRRRGVAAAGLHLDAEARRGENVGHVRVMVVAAGGSLPNARGSMDVDVQQGETRPGTEAG